MKLLVKRISQGDQDAFRQLFECYKDNVYTTVLRLCGDEFVAEEVLQDTFIRIWKYRDKLSEVADFDAWIFRVAKNVFLKKIKRIRFDVQSLDVLKHDLLDMNTACSLLEYKELSDVLDNAINKLSTKQKMTYHLIKQKGLSRKETAEILNVSCETVKWNLDEAIKKVRNYIAAFFSK